MKSIFDLKFDRTKVTLKFQEVKICSIPIIESFKLELKTAFQFSYLLTVP